MVKELACLARQEKSESQDSPTWGCCMQCNNYGPAFSFCENCDGHTEGIIYYPLTDAESRMMTQNNINNNNNQFEDSDDEDVLYGYDKVEEVSLPLFARDFHPNHLLHIHEQTDIFRNIPIEALFTKIHEDLETCLDLKSYLKHRCNEMKMFKYKTIPDILRNYDNLNFNIRLYNSGIHS
jgi:hypothetical protein